MKVSSPFWLTLKSRHGRLCLQCIQVVVGSVYTVVDRVGKYTQVLDTVFSILQQRPDDGSDALRIPGHQPDHRTGAVLSVLYLSAGLLPQSHFCLVIVGFSSRSVTWMTTVMVAVPLGFVGAIIGGERYGVRPAGLVVQLGLVGHLDLPVGSHPEHVRPGQRVVRRIAGHRPWR